MRMMKEGDETTLNCCSLVAIEATARTIDIRLTTYISILYKRHYFEGIIYLHSAHENLATTTTNLLSKISRDYMILFSSSLPSSISISFAFFIITIQI